jgi:hypothetical protein
VEYPTKELAEAALIVLDGFQLDKNHIFRAYHFSMLDNLKEPDPNWKEPQPKEYVDVVSILLDFWGLSSIYRVICGGTCKIRNALTNLQSKFMTARTVRLRQLFIGPTMEKIRATSMPKRLGFMQYLCNFLLFRIGPSIFSSGLRKFLHIFRSTLK